MFSVRSGFRHDLGKSYSDVRSDIELDCQQAAYATEFASLPMPWIRISIASPLFKKTGGFM